MGLWAVLELGVLFADDIQGHLYVNVCSVGAVLVSDARACAVLCCGVCDTQSLTGCAARSDECQPQWTWIDNPKHTSNCLFTRHVHPQLVAMLGNCGVQHAASSTMEAGSQDRFTALLATILTARHTSLPATTIAALCFVLLLQCSSRL